MSDTMTETETETVGVSDNYLYPNWSSYRSGGGGRSGTTLARGIIWALGSREVKKTLMDQTAPYEQYTYIREIETKYYKRFQYNPPEVSMSMNALATDPIGTEDGRAALDAGAVSMGAMNVSTTLIFTREEEVFRANNGIKGHVRMTDAALAVYGRVGVQKDIYDLYRILAASEITKEGIMGTAGTIGGEDVAASDYFTGDALPADPTMASLTGKIFDLAATGSWILSRAVALQFGDTNIFYGWVTGLSVTYNKFNYRLVPTYASVELNLDVMAARPSSAAAPSIWMGSTTTGGGSTTTTTTTPGSLVEPVDNYYKNRGPR